MIRPYLLFGDTELSKLKLALLPVVSAWATRWLKASSNDFCLEILAPDSDHDANWLAFKSGGAALYLQRPVGTYKTLTLAMFGDVVKTSGLSDTPSPLVAGSIASALQDLGATALRALEPNQQSNDVISIAESPLAETWASGSGAYMISIVCKPLHLRLLLPGTVTAAFLRSDKVTAARPSTPLENPLSLLTTRSVHIVAHLGEAEIDIGTLQSLEVGDVIKLGTRINQPAQLFSNDGTPLCHGYLGTRDGHKSLQLIR